MNGSIMYIQITGKYHSRHMHVMSECQAKTATPAMKVSRLVIRTLAEVVCHDDMADIAEADMGLYKVILVTVFSLTGYLACMQHIAP